LRLDLFTYFYFVVMDHISWDSPHYIGYTEKYIVDVDESIPEYLLTAVAGLKVSLLLLIFHWMSPITCLHGFNVKKHI